MHHHHHVVLPEFFTAYVTHVCPMRPRHCLARMVVPPPVKQLDIVSTVDRLDIPDDLRGVAMLQLIDDDERGLEVLQEASDIYRSALHFLQALVAHFS